MRPTLLALALLCAGAPFVHAAAPAAAPHATSPGTSAAAAEIGAHVLPKNLSVDMKIHADGKDFTMTRSTNENGDSRMDIVTDTGPFTMIQLNDEKKTMYMVSDARKEVIKQSSAAMMDRMGKHEKYGEAAPDSAKAPEGTIEKVGQETVNGVLADKYKVSGQGMDGFLWIDPTTGFMQRMQADNGTVDFTNYKVGAVTPEMLTPPKNYKVTDMDEMMAKMSGMGGMGGPGGMAKGMMGGMLGGMGSSMGGNLGGAAGGALGGMIGGPLGRMAGQYLGNKLGSKLGGKAASAAASKL
jgi:hypothetical protein